MIGVRDDLRRRGIGSALLDRVTGEARQVGRRSLQAFVVSQLSGDDELHPVEGGPGGVPVDAASTGFEARYGFRLVQAMVGAAVDVPLPPARLTSLEHTLPPSSRD